MTLETLMEDKMLAVKAKDITRRQALTNMIDAVQKTAITNKGRIEITEQLVDEVLIKYQKTVQEMLDTCPEARVELAAAYKAEMDIVKEYAPQLITNKGEIEQTINDILNGEIALTKSNRGTIMKLITPHFKGKADMKIVSEVVGAMLV